MLFYILLGIVFILIVIFTIIDDEKELADKIIVVFTIVLFYGLLLFDRSIKEEMLNTNIWLQLIVSFVIIMFIGMIGGMDDL